MKKKELNFCKRAFPKAVDIRLQDGHFRASLVSVSRDRARCKLLILKGFKLYIRFYAFSSTGCGNVCENHEETRTQRRV